MPQETEIENKGVKIGVKTLIIIIISAVSATWGVSVWINNYKSIDAQKFEEVDNKINAVNAKVDGLRNTMVTDSLLRDMRLRNYSRFYGNDTAKFH